MNGWRHTGLFSGKWIRRPAEILGALQIVIEKQELNIFSNPHAKELVTRIETDTEYAVFGVVTEYCVELAALGLLERGRRVAIVTDAIETLAPLTGRRVVSELQDRGARAVTTEEEIVADVIAQSGLPPEAQTGTNGR